MSLARFLTQLFEQGHVQVGRWDPLLPDADAEASEVLTTFERDWRLEFPGSPPNLHLPAACWAARSFYLACQLAAYRDVGEAAMDEALKAPCPAGDPSENSYSVDLVFRFLPDLVKLAAGLAPSDPLIERLRAWGREWPLSSVGMEGLKEFKVEPVVAHAGLLRCYLDRVLAKNDQSRLNDPRVRAAADAALGAFPELAKLHLLKGLLVDD